MGNTLPISSPPKPSPTRAVVFLEPQCIRSYLREPWRRPVGLLRVIGSTDELPTAFDGVVPLDIYRDILSLVADRAADYRGGQMQILVCMFQACLFLVTMLGFFLSKYMQTPLFSPIALVVLGSLEFAVLLQSGRFLIREEKKLVNELIQLLHPWRQEYGIIAKMRKTKGKLIGAENREGRNSSTHYCLVLDKSRPDHDADTVSLSNFTEMESDIDSQV